MNGRQPDTRTARDRLVDEPCDQVVTLASAGHRIERPADKFATSAERPSASQNSSKDSTAIASVTSPRYPPVLGDQIDPWDLDHFERPSRSHASSSAGISCLGSTLGIDLLEEGDDLLGSVEAATVGGDRHLVVGSGVRSPRAPWQSARSERWRCDQPLPSLHGSRLDNVRGWSVAAEQCHNLARALAAHGLWDVRVDVQRHVDR